MKQLIFEDWVTVKEYGEHDRIEATEGEDWTEVMMSWHSEDEARTSPSRTCTWEDTTC